MTNLNTVIYRYLDQVAGLLCKHSHFVKSPGLMDGRMGIALFLFRCFRVTNNDLYEKCAEEILDEIFEEINAEWSFNFNSGLCGIGYGVDYLIKNGYIEPESSDILEDMDNHIVSVTSNDSANVPDLLSAAKYWKQRENEELFTLCLSKVINLSIHEVGRLDKLHRKESGHPIFFYTLSDILLFYADSKIIPDQDAESLFTYISDPNYILEHLPLKWNEVYKYRKIVRAFGLDTEIPCFQEIRLKDILALRNSALQYGTGMPFDVKPKIEQILSEEDLMQEWIDLALPATMNINGYMTGFGWILLDFLKQKDSHKYL